MMLQVKNGVQQARKQPKVENCEFKNLYNWSLESKSKYDFIFDAWLFDLQPFKQSTLGLLLESLIASLVIFPSIIDLSV